jgi:UDPglucose 6-dehydrogenase
MRLSVVGCGYLGAVHAVAMASLGHEVIGEDIDPRRVDALAAGEAPFFEPGLQELLTSGIASGALRFTTDMSAVRGSTVHFVGVGTPQSRDGHAADLSYVDAAVSGLLPHLRDGDLVVGKSTVPVGTATRLASSVAPSGATLVWNPEFLREGFAVQDTIAPDRIVVGVGRGSDQLDAAEARAVQLLREVYYPSVLNGTPFLVTDYATAELVKVAANAFLATKISFINAMAEIAEQTGADVTQLADALGHDERIGRKFLGAGLGFGGGCLPKDIRAFAARAEELGCEDSVAFLREVDAINLRRRDRVVTLVRDTAGPDMSDTKVAVLGASFKPNSDDVRDSPALDVAARLDEAGARVVVTDPVAIRNAAYAYPHLTFEPDLQEAIRGSDVLVVATEWAQYRHELRPEDAAALARGRVVIDARNCLDGRAWSAAGWFYHAMGKPSIDAHAQAPGPFAEHLFDSSQVLVREV